MFEMSCIREDFIYYLPTFGGLIHERGRGGPDVPRTWINPPKVGRTRLDLSAAERPD